ncbi:ERVV2 protein, partial [Arenaria interpres]|nr:ERVV2 protein [Arenaria interpres]
TAKEGGVCLIINQSCCSYINQEQRIKTDIEQIWQQSKVLHQVSQDDTLLGFSNIWEKLTSWLPNLVWLRRLFVMVVIIIILILIICLMINCAFRYCLKPRDSYSKWKRNRLRQKLESNKYFRDL